MAVSVADIKKLRDQTGAGMMAAKGALEEAKGDMAVAVTILRKKGEITAGKRADKVAKAGAVDAYLHLGRVAALVEVNCETDFVARTDDFKNFTHDIVMQIAATNPAYISPADVPKSVIDKEREVYLADVSVKTKPKEVQAKIIDGKLDKFYQEVCLMSQPTIKDPDITVEASLAALVAKLGEKIVISRMVRFELGGK